MSGWLGVRYQTKDDWKSITLVFGEQSATTGSTTLMLASSVIVLDTGWSWFDIMISLLEINSDKFISSTREEREERCY